VIAGVVIALVWMGVSEHGLLRTIGRQRA
jgi:hypothetical protein